MVSQSTYRSLVLEDPDHQWEMHDGRLVEKPAMTFAHNDIMAELGFTLRGQLDRAEFLVRTNAGRVDRGDRSYYIPDVMVIPRAMIDKTAPISHALETYGKPLPLVVEIWSPSTGDYDIEDKLPEYRARGDQEIWRIHPFDRTLTIWRRQADGTYDEKTISGGTVHPVGLPGVAIDLDRLFNF